MTGKLLKPVSTELFDEQILTGAVQTVTFKSLAGSKRADKLIIEMPYVPISGGSLTKMRVEGADTNLKMGELYSSLPSTAGAYYDSGAGYALWADTSTLSFKCRIEIDHVSGAAKGISHETVSRLAAGAVGSIVLGAGWYESTSDISVLSIFHSGVQLSAGGIFRLYKQFIR